MLVWESELVEVGKKDARKQRKIRFAEAQHIKNTSWPPQIVDNGRETTERWGDEGDIAGVAQQILITEEVGISSQCKKKTQLAGDYKNAGEEENCSATCPQCQAGHSLLFSAARHRLCF